MKNEKSRSAAGQRKSRRLISIYQNTKYINNINNRSRQVLCTIIT